MSEGKAFVSNFLPCVFFCDKSERKLDDFSERKC